MVSVSHALLCIEYNQKHYKGGRRKVNPSHIGELLPLSHALQGHLLPKALGRTQAFKVTALFHSQNIFTGCPIFLLRIELSHLCCTY